ncbi:MAG: RNA polymerase sigma factor [Planctomycetes bacterium]|nr:RNA polymerase sigma factor [Planctomycetota bacterium]
MSSDSDGQLLRQWKAGQQPAFAELVQRHQSALLRHARAILGAGSPYEDVVQDVFLKLAESPPDLTAEALGDPERERVQLLSWLHKVTRNACMDTIRSDTRRKRREHAVASSEAADGGHASIEERDTRALVERELTKLPVDQREVLALRLMGERSYKEIAEITGKNVGTVGWLISVGLKALGEGLEPLLEGRKSAQRGGTVRIETGMGLAQGEAS